MLNSAMIAFIAIVMRLFSSRKIFPDVSRVTKCVFEQCMCGVEDEALGSAHERGENLRDRKLS